MRDTLVRELINLAEKDKNVWLLTADLGFWMFEPFISKFPKQFLNVGVAEQDLISVAAGLALAGKKVFVYSISPFASLRPCEQIRNDVCFQDLPVFVIGGGSLFSYGRDGNSHFALEDFGVMRSLPNMSVFSPSDPYELGILIKQIYQKGKPAYLRIAKRGEPLVHQAGDKIKIGQISKLKEGKDVLIAATGRQTINALQAAKELEEEKKLSCAVVSCHTLKPFDEAAIAKEARGKKLIITVEEHSTLGGLGTAIAEALTEASISTSFKKIGVPDEFPSIIGSQEYLLDHYNLSVKGIKKEIIKSLAKK